MKQYILILLLSTVTLHSQAQSLMTIQTDTLHSSEFGTQRSFRIALPSDRSNATPYNVIYVLDADYVFDILASTAIYLQTYDYIPPTAVVAVDYATQGSRADIGFSLTNLELNETGDRFYRYLNDELIPHINATLPTSGFNTLIGHSYTATY